MQVNVSCPDCARQLRLPEEVMGQSVRCPLCQVVFTARNPEATPPKPPARTPADDDLPLSLIEDDEPPREERRESRRRVREREGRPRPAREREDRDDRRPPRRPSPTRGFALFVHRDPREKLAGEFKAEFDADGLTFWRGRGREITIPFGGAAEYLGDGRLLLEVEGRKVEATAVHGDGMHDELAREVAHALGNGDEPFRMPLKPRGMVVWLSLLPLALPLLAWVFGDDIAGLGGLITFSFLGAVLAGLALIFAMQRRVATATRAWTAVGLALGGFLVLGIALRVDHSGPPEPPADFSHWIAFAPIDGGFSAEFPGLPEFAMAPGSTQPISFSLSTRYAVERGGKTDLVVGYGTLANAPVIFQDLKPGRAGLHLANILSQRPLDGGVEVQFKANDGRSGVARYFVKDNRLFGITFVSRKLSPTSPEATRFLDSFAFDSTTGWPGPGTTGLKPIAAAVPNMPGMPGMPGMPNMPGMPGFPNINIPPINPPVDANLPGTKLGPDGTLLFAHNRNFVWTGYRAKTGEVIGVAVEGLVYVCDDTGKKLRQATVDAGGTVSGAALSPDGKKLAVLGVNNNLLLVDADTLKPTTFPPDTRVDVPQGGAAFSPDGKFLATTHGDQKVRIWDVEKKAVVKRFPLDRSQAVSVAFSHDGKELVCGAGGTLFLLDANDGRIITRLKDDFAADLRIMAMSADGTVVAGGIDPKLRFWKLPAPTPKTVNSRGDKATAVAFNPAGGLVAVADALGRLSLFDATTQAFRAAVSRVQTGPLNIGQIRCVAFSASGDKLLVADGPRLECWNIRRHLRLPADLIPVTPRKPAGPSELQDRGKLLGHQFALVCREKKCALLFTADKKVHRYSYPEWKLTKSSPFPIAVGSAALDARSGTLYAVEGGGDRPRMKRENDLLAYDIADLLDGKALPDALEAKKKLRVGFDPRNLLLDASGKSLYYAEGAFTKLAVRRLDTGTFEAPRTIFDNKQCSFVQITMSPDGKELYVLASEAAFSNPVVVRFEAGAGKQEKELAIPQNLGMSLQMGGDGILLRGRDGLARLDWASSQVTVLSPHRNEPGAWLAPSGTRLYVEGFIPHTLSAYDVPADATALPAPAFTMELREPIRHPTQRGPAPLFSPDGRFLLFPTGRLIGLGKDAKPAEPDPEP